MEMKEPEKQVYSCYDCRASTALPTQSAYINGPYLNLCSDCQKKSWARFDYLTSWVAYNVKKTLYENQKKPPVKAC